MEKIKGLFIHKPEETGQVLKELLEDEFGDLENLPFKVSFGTIKSTKKIKCCLVSHWEENPCYEEEDAEESFFIEFEKPVWVITSRCWEVRDWIYFLFSQFEKLNLCCVRGRGDYAVFYFLSDVSNDLKGFKKFMKRRCPWR